MNKGHAGLLIAGAGVGLFLVDKFTTPNGGSGGSVYGPNGVLAAVKTKSPVDPTVALVVIGLSLWAWHKFGK